MQTKISTRCQPLLCLLAIAALTVWLGQASPANAQDGTTRTAKVLSESNNVEATNRLDAQAIEPGGDKTGLPIKSDFHPKTNSTSPSRAASSTGDDDWHFEVKPYLRLGAVNAMGQEASVSKPNKINRSQVETKQDVVSIADSSLKRITSLSATSPNANTALPSNPQSSDDDSWHMEIRPYLWGAGMFGRLRVRNTTADTGKSATAILGMLDFAAAVQLEAKRNRWTIMFDENYVNLGTTATGPLGASTIDVEPTMNLFEFGASYEFARVANNDATANDPLPPVFSAEVLGGGRYIHLSLSLEPENTAAVEGSKNLIGVFAGNRVKVRPHRAVTLIGKYTVGTSGIGSQFAWSADALVDLRLKKSFSIGGGYRWLGLNADDVNNVAGFDGTMRGLILSATIYR